MTDTKQRIRQYLSMTIRCEVGDDEDLFERAVVDSLFAIQLVAFIEQEFSIKAEPTDLDINNFCSISAMTRFVECKQMKVGSDERRRFRDR